MKHYRRIVERKVPDRPYQLPQLNPSQSESESESSSDATTLPTLAPGLLALNHQIYAEAQPILYSANTFALEDTYALHAFLANIGPRNTALLANITILGWGRSRTHKALNHPALTLLANAVNLRCLRLDDQIGWASTPQSVARQVYRDGFHFLEAVGVAKGKRDAAVEIIEVHPEDLMSSWYRPASGSQGGLSPEERLERFRNELRKLLR